MTTLNRTPWIAAIGLFGLALYQLTTGDYLTAVQSSLAALGVLGLHLGTAKLTK